MSSLRLQALQLTPYATRSDNQPRLRRISIAHKACFALDIFVSPSWPISIKDPQSKHTGLMKPQQAPHYSSVHSRQNRSRTTNRPKLRSIDHLSSNHHPSDQLTANSTAGVPTTRDLRCSITDDHSKPVPAFPAQTQHYQAPKLKPLLHHQVRGTIATRQPVSTPPSPAKFHHFTHDTGQLSIAAPPDLSTQHHHNSSLPLSSKLSLPIEVNKKLPPSSNERLLASHLSHACKSTHISRSKSLEPTSTP